MTTLQKQLPTFAKNGANRRTTLDAPAAMPLALGKAVMACRDNLEFMREIPDASIQLIVTSPPYNLGKSYEKRSSD